MPVKKREKRPIEMDSHAGRQLRLRRLQLEMSQTKLAEHVELTFQQIQKYENGSNRISASRLQQFVEILRVPVSYFFEGGPGINLKSSSADTSADYVVKFTTSANGAALMKAFSRIKDRNKRRAIAKFVKQIAGGGD